MQECLQQSKPAEQSHSNAHRLVGCETLAERSSHWIILSNCFDFFSPLFTGERPFVCDFKNCQKSFTRNEELTRHRRIHSGIRPYPCRWCDKRFGRKDHLRKHERTHERRLRSTLLLNYTASLPANAANNLLHHSPSPSTTTTNNHRATSNGPLNLAMLGQESSSSPPPPSLPAGPTLLPLNGHWKLLWSHKNHCLRRGRRRHRQKQQFFPSKQMFYSNLKQKLKN